MKITTDEAHEEGIRSVAIWLYCLVGPVGGRTWDQLKRGGQEPYYREARTLVNRYQLAVDAYRENEVTS